MRIRSFLIAGVLAGISSVSMAAAVSFKPMAADSSEASVIRGFVPNVELQSAVIDLDGDGSAELFARDNADCDAQDPSLCRTVILRHRFNDWKVIFDQRVGDIEVGEPGYGGMNKLTANGNEWDFTSVNGYRVDIVGTGEPVALSLAPADYVDLLTAQFGEGAVALFAAQRDVKVNIGQVKINETGDQALLVRLEGPGVCGMIYGCPWRLLQVKDGAYQTLLEGTGSGAVAVMPVTRSGWNDIGAQLPGDGFVTYGWNGSAYAVSQLVKGN